MEFTTLDGLAIQTLTFGSKSGTPVVLIHGIGADHDMWKPQFTSFPEAGYFTIIPDLRGHGASGVPEHFSIRDCANDLNALLDALGVKQAHLVGVSMGGMVAQQFTADFPQRVRSQVLVDSLSGATRPVERFNAGLAAFLLKFLPANLQASMLRSTYQRMGHPEVAQYFSDRLLAMDAGWLLMAREEVNRFNIIASLPAIKTPTLVLVGDGFGKMAIDMAHTTAELIPNAEFQVLKGGGDPSNLLVPEVFDQAVIGFINQHK